MPRENKPRYRKDRDCWVSKIDGRLIILARGHRNRAEAVKELRRLLSLKQTGHAASITVAELFDRLLAWTHENRSQLTFEWYARHLRSFAEFVGRGTAADAIKPFHVDRWLERHAWGQATRHGAITAVKRAFAWGRKKGYLERDPLDGIDKPPMPRRESILTPEQERAAIDTARGPLRDLLSFLHETGCRPSEACRLEAGHVSIADGVATMHSKTTSRTGRQRVVYLTEAALQIVLPLIQAHPSGSIFRNFRGRPWTPNALVRAMRRLRKRLGLGGECTAESFRHGWVTDAKLRLPNSVVAELAGHTSTAMIDKHYGHVSERRDELARAARQVRGD